MTALTRAWITLLLLSAAATAVSVLLGGGYATAAGAAILVLAWAKARLILVRYLGLHAAPSWRRGFETVLAFYAIALLGLYLAA